MGRKKSIVILSCDAHDSDQRPVLQDFSKGTIVALSPWPSNWICDPINRREIMSNIRNLAKYL